MKLKSITKSVVLFSALSFCSVSFAQDQDHEGFAHSSSSKYTWPTNPQVLQNLDKWQDQKFGVLLHWGLYSVPGIVESWSICSEDVDWISRKEDLPYDQYKEWYWGLKDSLNPVNFDPEQWATAMNDAGMKYVIFTTKHHDGFNMYDTSFSDFSIANGPFANNEKKDVARHVWDAFRDKGFMTGVYFSKPDWHSEYYWWPNYATPDRNVNYKIDRHPEQWQKFQEFTANQIDELMTKYGNQDILWLDGGWVAKDNNQDIKLDEIVAKARETQPNLLVVDRTIAGVNENYQTPERSIPDTQIDNPWESCITLSHDWGWTPNAPYKSPNEVIAMLTEVTAKGGSLLLGVGPTADGIIEQEAIDILANVGEWLNANGEAIYATRNAKIYNDGNVWFTANKNGKTIYAIYTLSNRAEASGKSSDKLPKTIEWTGNVPVGKMILLKTGKPVKYSVHNGVVKVYVPKGLKNEALAFKFDIK